MAKRAAILMKAADLYEDNAVEFFALATREAGKTLADGVAEVREAVDFLRYYATEAEKAEAGTEARGVIACISPWNFPLAIFTGQVAAALVTGNAVVAKPAEQTPLIAARAVELLRKAGVPEDVIQLLPGDGPSVGAPLTADPRIAGVCFTGSTDVAKLIEKQLAKTAAADAMLIAETGGLNAMIVDSTALPEQAVRDILASSFQSAGQRCSALRILYVQKDVEKKVIEMLEGAMNALKVGDPWELSTDVGPVIDVDAQKSIKAYCADLEKAGKLIAKLDAPKDGRFVAPHVFRVKGIEEMDREIFGPVLHVATFKANDLDKVISSINRKGYGLTFGLHTRIEGRVQHLVDAIHAGNVYVNRNQIGAIVGSQPFGGEGLSGTGPKAGGPHYLRRFRKAVGGVQAVYWRKWIDHRRKGAERSYPGCHTGRLVNAAGPHRHPAQAFARQGVCRRECRGRHRFRRGRSARPDRRGEYIDACIHAASRSALGRMRETLLSQAVQALAAGCAVLAVAPGASSALNALTGKGLPIAALDGVVDPAHLAKLPVDVVAFAGDEGAMRAIRQALAGRAGPIVPLVTEAIYPVAYAHERAVCVDTTAAGGNASLLAAA